MSCSIPEHSDIPIHAVPPLPSGRQKPGATRLADLTTMGVGGEVRHLVEAQNDHEIIAAVTAADEAGEPLLMLGGGSNILADDAPFDGTVIRDMRSQITLTQEGGCEGANLRVVAGTSWDELVVHTIENEWAGLEALSGIPGTVGAAPVQYGQLAKALGVEIGTRVPSVDVRAAVLDLRRSKGMVLDDVDQDSYSCGSFFTNPILTEEAAALLPEDAPRFAVVDQTKATLNLAAPTIDGLVKTSAAWLIQHAGFPAGYGMPGPAALSTKHTLALTNRGTATAADVAALARVGVDGVEEAFGVRLVPEPVWVGLTL